MVVTKSEDSIELLIDNYVKLSDVSINSNQTLKLFEELGYSDKEIIELYQNDANALRVSIKLPYNLYKRTGINVVIPQNNMMLGRFPSNPTPGQIYNYYYDVDFVTAFRHAGLIGYGVGGVASVIANYSPSVVIKAIAAAIGAGAFAVILAQKIYYNSKMDKGYSGVRGGATYKWTWNNDMIYDWIYLINSSWEEFY